MHVRCACWPAFELLHILRHSDYHTSLLRYWPPQRRTASPAEHELHVLRLTIDCMCERAILQHAQQTCHVTACNCVSSEAGMGTCMDRTVT